MKRIVIAGIAALCLTMALPLGGTAPLGRVLLGLGLPRAAAGFLSDPAWRGVALYRAGHAEAAAEAFARAGEPLNLGNAHVRAGRYAAALEAYDIARLGKDARAAANFDLVAAYYAGLALDAQAPVSWFTERDDDGPTVQSFIAQGDARAVGTGSDTTNSGALPDLPQLNARGGNPVRKVFDDKFIVANRRWLQTLEDVPGAYLAARIRHESKRRKKLGLTPPDPEDPR